MTRILTIIALLFATPAWAEQVFYCVDEGSTGFRYDAERKERERVGFTSKKFRVFFDLPKENLGEFSGKIDGHITKCFKRTNIAECINYRGVGDHFYLDLKSGNYSRVMSLATHAVSPENNDLYVSYGTCEKF